MLSQYRQRFPRLLKNTMCKSILTQKKARILKQIKGR
jgi:hypothetical protein